MIDRILNQQQRWANVNGGAVPDLPDERDYDAEVLMGAIIPFPSFEEGFNALKDTWLDMPNKNQLQQLSCVGQSWAHYKQVLQAKDTGEHTELSAKSIQNPIAIPGTGAYVRDGGLRTVHYGVNKEITVPSGGTEAEVTAPMDFAPFKDEAAFFKNIATAWIRTQDFDVLARSIYQNGGFVSGWGNHAQYFKGYGIIQGRRYLLTHNSYGPNSDMYFFEGMGETLFSSWTAVDMKNVASHKLRLVRGAGEDEVWFILNGKRYLVRNPKMMQDGFAEGIWGGFAGVEVIPVLDLRQFPVAKLSFSDFLKTYFAK